MSSVSDRVSFIFSVELAIRQSASCWFKGIYHPIAINPTMKRPDFSYESFWSYMISPDLQFLNCGLVISITQIAYKNIVVSWNCMIRLLEMHDGN